MCAVEELLQGDEVAEALPHFLPIDGDHVVMHPVAHHLVALAGHGLCNLTFMVWEDKVHAAAVNIEVVAEVFPSHGRAFAVPTGKTNAPWARPTHDMLGLGLLPKGEVCLILLLAHAVQRATVVDDVRQVAPRKDAIFVFLVVFLHVEVDASVAFVGITIVENLFDQLFLLDDMARGMRFNRWRKHVECLHCRMITVGIVLRNLHRLQLFQPCFLLNLVISLVGVVFQVANVGDIAHVAHLVAQVFQVAEHYIKGDCGPRMPQMWVTIDGRSADIHAHIGRMQRLEQLLTACECIVNQEILFHVLRLFEYECKVNGKKTKRKIIFFIYWNGLLSRPCCYAK